MSDRPVPVPGLLSRLALAVSAGALVAAWLLRGAWKDSRLAVAEQGYVQLGFLRNAGIEARAVVSAGADRALEAGLWTAGLALLGLLAVRVLPPLRTPAALVGALRSGPVLALTVALWSAFCGLGLWDLAQGRALRGAGWLTPDDLGLAGCFFAAGLAWIALVAGVALAGRGGRWHGALVRALAVGGLILLAGGYWANRGAWSPPRDPGLARLDLVLASAAVAAAGGMLWQWGLGRGLALPALAAGAAALGLAAGPWVLSSARATDQPTLVAARPLNVVVIALDTVRADQTSLLAERPDGRDTTPNLRALAERGVNFRNAVTQAPWTIPAFASILTGRYPHEHGALVLDASLSPGQVTLAEVLRETGYQTLGVVSHMFLQRYRGFAQGYDAYDERPTQQGDVHRAASSIPVTDGAIELLRGRDPERPFFLFAHYFDPHYEYLDHAGWKLADGYQGWFRGQLDFENLQKNGRLLREEDRRWLFDLYQEELLYTDRHVGRLLTFLEESGLDESTLIVVVADHGEAFGEHDAYYGHTISMQQEVLHVPLVVVPPAGSGVAPRTVDEVVETRSVFGTVLAELGVAPADGGPDGAWTPGWARKHSLLGDADVGGQAFSGVFLDATDPRHGKRFKHAALVRGHHKVSYDMTRGVLELFDLEADPGETTPLGHGRNEEVLVPMREALHEWVQRMQSTAQEVRRVPLTGAELDDMRALGYGDGPGTEEPEATVEETRP